MINAWPKRLLENWMPITAVTAAAAMTLVSATAALHGQRPAAQPVAPRSLVLLHQGEAAQAAGNLASARNLLETALAVDPRNREAFVVLARVVEAQGLDGKAIRLYNEALAIDPDDVTALGGQGQAMVAKGAMKSAQQNLVKIRKICGANACADGDRLAAEIAKGPPPMAKPTVDATSDAAKDDNTPQ